MTALFIGTLASSLVGSIFRENNKGARRGVPRARTRYNKTNRMDKNF